MSSSGQPDSEEYAEFEGRKTNKKYVGVMINANGGPLRFNSEALELYHKKGGHVRKDKVKHGGKNIPRTDPVMIDVVQELHDEDIGISLVPYMLRTHFSIIYEEEDHEAVFLDVKGFRMELVEKMMQSVNEGGYECESVHDLKQAVLKALTSEFGYGEFWDEAQGIQRLPMGARRR